MVLVTAMEVCNFQEDSATSNSTLLRTYSRYVRSYSV